MSEDKLIAPKAKDNFTSESPIRAFTDFRVSGTVAIGKGFRPSLAHLHTYLDAMQAKEGWRFVQVILPDTDAGDPTILFHKEGAPPVSPTTLSAGPQPADDLGAPHREHVHILTLTGWCSGIYLQGEWHVITAMIGDKVTRMRAIKGVTQWKHLPSGDSVMTVEQAREEAGGIFPIHDDPINPKHYDGTACAEIGELLTPNTYQTLKYCWRLGKKDDPCQELGKGLWYLDREIILTQNITKRVSYNPRREWLEERIADQPTFTQNIARMLWQGYHEHGMTERMLRAVKEAIEEHRFHLDCGRGLAI